MKKSELTFAEGFLGIQYDQAKRAGNLQMAFDWDKAAQIIKDHLKEHPDLIAEAGLERDWNYTGGIIFENGKPTSDNYTYLSSNWAKPTLILSWDFSMQKEIECFTTDQNSRFDSGNKWDDQSLQILTNQ